MVGMKLKDLAHGAGISKTHVSLIETNQRRLTPETVDR